MRILFLTDNFPPEVNAPAVRTFAHCREWVRAGAEVTVITCAPNFPRGEVYEGYANRLVQRELMEGVKVIRVWSYMAPNAGFVRRILDYVSFAIAGVVAASFERFDVVVATSPQFFTAVAGAVVGNVKRRPWVFELRDFWPESIVATGAMSEGAAISMLERLEMTLYRSARLIVPVTGAFKARLIDRGIDSSKIAVVTNGVEMKEFATSDGCGWGDGQSRPFRVGYVGTHGLAHGLDLVLRTACIMSGDEVEFVLVGDGADKSNLLREHRRLGLDNVSLRDPVQRDAIAELLGSFDACLVPLKDSETFRSVIPSKIFEAAAARRPILLGVQGESKDIVEEYGAGLAFYPESEAELAGAIRRLRGDRELYRSLQSGAERMAHDFDRGALARKMLSFLERLAEPTARDTSLKQRP